MTNLDIKPMRRGPPILSEAVDRIASNMAAHEMRDPVDIVETLSLLAQTGEPVTVYREGQDYVMARVDLVDRDGKVLVLDLADRIDDAPPRLQCVAPLGGSAKVQFELEPDWHSRPGAGNLVDARLPDRCQVLNRRAEPRLDTPVGGNYGARFAIFGKVYELPLYDFSGSGVGLRATPEQALDLYVGKKLDGVQLELGPSLAITADLEIRLLRPFRTFLLGQQVQVGCRISNITMQMRQSLERAVAVHKRR